MKSHLTLRPAQEPTGLLLRRNPAHQEPEVRRQASQLDAVPVSEALGEQLLSDLESGRLVDRVQPL